MPTLGHVEFVPGALEPGERRGPIEFAGEGAGRPQDSLGDFAVALGGETPDRCDHA